MPLADMEYHLWPTIDGMRVDLFFDRKHKQSGKWMVPCFVSDKPYIAEIDPETLEIKVKPPLEDAAPRTPSAGDTHAANAGDGIAATEKPENTPPPETVKKTASGNLHIPILREGPRFSESGTLIQRFRSSSLTNPDFVEKLAGKLAAKPEMPSKENIIRAIRLTCRFYKQHGIRGPDGKRLADFSNIDIREGLQVPAQFDPATATMIFDIDLFKVLLTDMRAFLVFVTGHEGEHSRGEEAAAVEEDTKRFYSWSKANRASVIRSLTAFGADSHYVNTLLKECAESYRHEASDPANSRTRKRELYQDSILYCEAALRNSPPADISIAASNCKAYAANELGRLAFKDLVDEFGNPPSAQNEVKAADLYAQACDWVYTAAFPSFANVIHNSGKGRTKGLPRALAGYAFGMALLVDLELAMAESGPERARQAAIQKALTCASSSLRYAARGIKADIENEHVISSAGESLSRILKVLPKMPKVENIKGARQRISTLNGILNSLSEIVRSLSPTRASSRLKSKVDACIALVTEERAKHLKMVEIHSSLPQYFLEAACDAQISPSEFDDYFRLLIEVACGDKFTASIVLKAAHELKTRGVYDEHDAAVIRTLVPLKASRFVNAKTVNSDARKIDPWLTREIIEERIRSERYAWLGLEPSIIEEVSGSKSTAPPVAPRIVKAALEDYGGADGKGGRMAKLKAESALVRPWLEDNDLRILDRWIDQADRAFTALKGTFDLLGQKRSIDMDGQKQLGELYHGTARSLGFRRTFDFAQEKLKMKLHDGPERTIEPLKSRIDRCLASIRKVTSVFNTPELAAVETQVLSAKNAADSLSLPSSPNYLSIDIYRCLTGETDDRADSDGSLPDIDTLETEIARITERFDARNRYNAGLEEMRKTLTGSEYVRPESERLILQINRLQERIDAQFTSGTAAMGSSETANAFDVLKTQVDGWSALKGKALELADKVKYELVRRIAAITSHMEFTAKADEIPAPAGGVRDRTVDTMNMLLARLRNLKSQGELEAIGEDLATAIKWDRYRTELAEMRKTLTAAEYVKPEAERLLPQVAELQGRLDAQPSSGTPATMGSSWTDSAFDALKDRVDKWRALKGRASAMAAKVNRDLGTRIATIRSCMAFAPAPENVAQYDERVRDGAIDTMKTMLGMLERLKDPRDLVTVEEGLAAAIRTLEPALKTFVALKNAQLMHKAWPVFIYVAAFLFKERMILAGFDKSKVPEDIWRNLERVEAIIAGIVFSDMKEPVTDLWASHIPEVTVVLKRIVTSSGSYSVILDLLWPTLDDENAALVQIMQRYVVEGIWGVVDDDLLIREEAERRDKLRAQDQLGLFSMFSAEDLRGVNYAGALTILNSIGSSYVNAPALQDVMAIAREKFFEGMRSESGELKALFDRVTAPIAQKLEAAPEGTTIYGYTLANIRDISAKMKMGDDLLEEKWKQTQAVMERLVRENSLLNFRNRHVDAVAAFMNARVAMYRAIDEQPGKRTTRPPDGSPWYVASLLRGKFKDQAVTAEEVRANTKGGMKDGLLSPGTVKRDLGTLAYLGLVEISASAGDDAPQYSAGEMLLSHWEHVGPILEGMGSRPSAKKKLSAKQQIYHIRSADLQRVLGEPSFKEFAPGPMKEALEWLSRNREELGGYSLDLYVLALSMAGKLPKEADVEAWRRTAAAYDLYLGNAELREYTTMPFGETIEWLDKNRSKFGDVSLGYLVRALWIAGRLPEDANIKNWEFKAGAYDLFLKTPLLKAYEPRTLKGTLRWLADNREQLGGRKLGYLMQALSTAGKLPSGSNAKEWEMSASAYELYLKSPVLKEYRPMPLKPTLRWLSARRRAIGTGSSLAHLINALDMADKLPKGVNPESWIFAAGAYDMYLKNPVLREYRAMPVQKTLLWLHENRHRLGENSLSYMLQGLDMAGRLPPKPNVQVFAFNAGAFERALSEKGTILREIKRIFENSARRKYCRTDYGILVKEFDRSLIPNLRRPGRTLSESYIRFILKFAYELYGKELIASIRAGQAPAAPGVPPAPAAHDAGRKTQDEPPAPAKPGNGAQEPERRDRPQNGRSVEFTIKTDRKFVFSGATVEQRSFDGVMSEEDKIRPVIIVSINGSEYRIGGRHFIVVTLADGKKVYWGGQHNLSASFYFDHFRERAWPLAASRSLLWRHIDAHLDRSEEDYDPFRDKEDWRKGLETGTMLSEASYIGHLMASGIIQQQLYHYIYSIDDMRAASERNDSAQETVVDLDIDVVTAGLVDGFRNAEFVLAQRFAEMQPYLVSMASRSSVSFFTNSSELSRDYLGSPLYIDPHLAAVFNATIIGDLARMAADAGPTREQPPSAPAAHIAGRKTQDEPPATDPKRPTVGSLAGVFTYLCDKDITGYDNALTGEEIARRMQRSYDHTIRLDIRALLYLGLISEVKQGKELKYRVPKGVKAAREAILPVLMEFRGEKLRPNRALLELYKTRLRLARYPEERLDRYSSMDAERLSELLETELKRPLTAREKGQVERLMAGFQGIRKELKPVETLNKMLTEGGHPDLCIKACREAKDRFGQEVPMGMLSKTGFFTYDDDEKSTLYPYSKRIRDLWWDFDEGDMPVHLYMICNVLGVPLVVDLTADQFMMDRAQEKYMETGIVAIPVSRLEAHDWPYVCGRLSLAIDETYKKHLYSIVNNDRDLFEVLAGDSLPAEQVPARQEPDENGFMAPPTMLAALPGHTYGPHQNFAVIRGIQNQFLLSHNEGEVSYQVFLWRNYRAFDEKGDEIELTYDIFVSRKDAPPKDFQENQYNYKGFLSLRFDAAGVLKSGVPDINDRRKAQFPWLEDRISRWLAANTGKMVLTAEAARAAKEIKYGTPANTLMSVTVRPEGVLGRNNPGLVGTRTIPVAVTTGRGIHFDDLAIPGRPIDGFEDDLVRDMLLTLLGHDFFGKQPTAQNEPPAAPQAASAGPAQTPASANTHEQHILGLMQNGNYYHARTMIKEYAADGVPISREFLQRILGRLIAGELANYAMVPQAEKDLLTSIFAQQGAPWDAIEEAVYHQGIGKYVKESIVARIGRMADRNVDMPSSLGVIPFKYYFGIDRMAPARFRDFTFVRLLGGGTEGTAFEVIDRRDNCRYAVKVTEKDQHEHALFIMERLRGRPRFVEYFDVGIIGQYCYVKKTLCAGDEICHWNIEHLKSKKIPASRTMAILLELTDIFSEALSLGILPGDSQCFVEGAGTDVRIKMFDYGHWQPTELTDGASYDFFDEEMANFYCKMLSFALDDIEARGISAEDRAFLAARCDAVLNNAQARPGQEYSFRKYLLLLRGVLKKSAGDTAGAAADIACALAEHERYNITDSLQKALGRHYEPLAAMAASSADPATTPSPPAAHDARRATQDETPAPSGTQAADKQDAREGAHKVTVHVPIENYKPFFSRPKMSRAAEANLSSVITRMAPSWGVKVTVEPLYVPDGQDVAIVTVEGPYSEDVLKNIKTLIAEIISDWDKLLDDNRTAGYRALIDSQAGYFAGLRGQKPSSPGNEGRQLGSGRKKPRPADTAPSVRPENAATPGTPMTLRDLKSPEELTLNLVEYLLSLASTKKVVLAFEKEIAGCHDGRPICVFEMLSELKKSERFKSILSNLEIISAPADKLEAEIDKYSGLKNTEIFMFARKEARETLRSLEGRVHSSYIDETELPLNSYYPLTEVVVLALEHYFSPYVTAGNRIGSITVGNITLALKDINIESISPEDGALIFKLLPKAEPCKPSDLTKRYAELKRFLKAA